MVMGRFGQWSDGAITLLCQGALHLLVGERGAPTHGFTPEHQEETQKSEYRCETLQFLIRNRHLELSCRLEAGGCAVRASPGRLGSLAEPQRRGTSP